MSSLTDLRETLGDHAEGVTDTATAARVAAVHHRIAGVRRRRRVAGAGTVGLVVLAGAAGVLVPRITSDAMPAAPVVLGQQAPTTMTALGWGYRTDGHSVTFSGSGSLKISAADTPRLYSWTTDRPATVRVVLPNGDVWRSQANHFTDYVAVSPGQSGTLRVSVPKGHVGLASYVLGDPPPAGYTKDGVTFRQTVADAPLLGAVISDRGQVDADTTYVAPQGWLGLHLSCSGLPKGDSVHVSFNGSERVAGGCDDPTTFDPGASWGSQFPAEHPGRRVVLRVWVTHGDESSTPVAAGSAPDLRMYVAVYGPVEHQRLGGYSVDRYVEHAGHLWAVADYASGGGLTPGRLVTVGAMGYQGPAAMAWRTRGRTDIRFLAQGMRPQTGSFSGGRASVGDLWVPQGSSVRYGLTRGTGSAGVAFYDRVD